MVKISFVVGGGKQCRQKYSEDLPKDFMQALDAIGFDSDNAACLELASGGKYKFQHDTSKNLKFVHVFPRVVLPAAAEENENDGGGAAAEKAARDPVDVLAECELDAFQRLVTAHVLFYATKKRLLDGLRERIASLDEAERKLIAREQLGDKLQLLYDSLSADGLKEKVRILAGELQACIDGGQLTPDDRELVLEQLDSKLTLLQAELAKAEAEGKVKLQAKLEEQREKLRASQAAVKDSKAAPIAPLKYGSEIRKLHSKLAGLARLEKESSGKFTIDELKRLGERPDIEEAISVMKSRSRTWLESDDEFNRRLQHCLAQAEPKKKPSTAPSGGGYRADGSNAWQTAKRR
jgi:hypothetical protein